MNTHAPDAITVIQAANWIHAPFGIVAIDRAGKICAANPAFEDMAYMPASDIVGKSEETLFAILAMLQYDHHRIEDISPGLRTLHYITTPARHIDCDHCMAHHLERLHDPLTVISGCAELLAAPTDPGNNRQPLAQLITEQAKRLMRALDKSLP